MRPLLLSGIHSIEANQLLPACQSALVLQGSASARVALQGSASARLALQGSASARMALQGSVSATMALQGSASARVALQRSPCARLSVNPCLAAGVGRSHICRASGDAPRHWLPIEPAGHKEKHSACMRPALRMRSAQASTMRQPSWLRDVLSKSHIRPDCCLSCTSVYTHRQCVHSVEKRQGCGCPACGQDMHGPAN